jgi:hypothetical protein
MKTFLSRIYERHAIAFLLFCYFVTLLDSRGTTGTVGWILSHMPRFTVFLMASWCFCGGLWLLVAKAKPVTMAIASLPILAYAVFGVAFVLDSQETAPIGAFFIHLGVYVTILVLISLRIRALAKGTHRDDTILPDSGAN